VAQYHVKALTECDRVEAIVLCDIVEEKERQLASKHSIRHVFHDHRDLLVLQEAEAVSMLTYKQALRGLTVNALRAGKHVLVADPMAATLDDAVAMTRAADETGKIVMVGVVTRFGPVTLAAKQIVDPGAIGHIYYVEAAACRRGCEPVESSDHRATRGYRTVDAT